MTQGRRREYPHGQTASCTWRRRVSLALHMTQTSLWKRQTIDLFLPPFPRLLILVKAKKQMSLCEIRQLSQTDRTQSSLRRLRCVPSCEGPWTDPSHMTSHISVFFSSVHRELILSYYVPTLFLSVLSCPVQSYFHYAGQRAFFCYCYWQNNLHTVSERNINT